MSKLRNNNNNNNGNIKQHRAKRCSTFKLPDWKGRLITEVFSIDL